MKTKNKVPEKFKERFVEERDDECEKCKKEKILTWSLKLHKFICRSCYNKVWKGSRLKLEPIGG